MKGRNSVPEHEEDASTQLACRAVVGMVLETPRDTGTAPEREVCLSHILDNLLVSEGRLPRKAKVRS